ncbi:Ataxin-7-like protein 3 [Linnemannia schmuckeri]|uniref:SAGA-associated factor 11 n=1 Tax=Linnemannia schmuckeri TaxID=64567 RepID=A0A9P5RS65_9FUNG|nr:Ataxin-7-like protein 3 [Linnemannia schmuckeri]
MSSPLARSASTMSSTDMEALFAKIHKDQASQLELLRHTKRAMDKTIASSKDGPDSAAASLASLSFEILGDLLDEIVLDVVSEAHREVKNMRTVCPICKTKCRNYVVRSGQDIFGQNPQPSNSQTFDCVHCQRSFPAQRYAPHLEKCLGLAGRSSSRAASRRMGAERAGSGSPFTPVSYSDDREASDSDKDLIEKKRKKNAAKDNFQSNGNGAGGINGGADYVTPSPVKTSSSKIKKQKQMESADYPAKPPKSSLLAKSSKSGSSTKLKGLGLHTPSSTAAATVPRDPTPVGEISLGFLDDSLLLANGRSLQNGSGGGGNENSNGTSSATGAAAASATATTTGATQKLSSSNPKRASGGGVSSSKRPPGSSGPSSKNGQVLSFYDSLRAIGSPEGATSDDDDSSSKTYNTGNHYNNINNGDDDYNDVNVHKNKKKKNSGDDGRRKKNRGKRGLSFDDDDDYDDSYGDEYIERDGDKGNDHGNGDENFSAMDGDEHAEYGVVGGGGGGSGGMVGVSLPSSSSYSSSSKASSQRLPPLVLRLKKSSAYSGATTDAHDMEFIDIDGDGDEDGMDVLQTPKKKKS